MRSTLLQWSLIAACALGLLWQQSKISDLEQTVASQSSVAAESKSDIVRPEAEVYDTQFAHKERDPSVGQLESRVASLEKRGAIVDQQIEHLLKTERTNITAGHLAENNEGPDTEIERALDIVLSDPATAEHLRTVIREEQDAVWQKRREERRERRRERLNEEIQALKEMLELSGSEAESFNKMLVSENDAIRGFWGQVRSGELSRSQARQATRLRRVETDNQVKELIDENRYASFENWRNERYRRNRR